MLRLWPSATYLEESRLSRFQPAMGSREVEGYGRGRRVKKGREVKMSVFTWRSLRADSVMLVTAIRVSWTEAVSDRPEPPIPGSRRTVNIHNSQNTISTRKCQHQCNTSLPTRNIFWTALAAYQVYRINVVVRTHVKLEGEHSVECKTSAANTAGSLK